MSAEIKGQAVEATPLVWSESMLALLARDGRLLQVKPGDVKNFRKTANTFSPLTAAEMRDLLQRELGSRFEVSGTGHYLIACPLGQKDRWTERFEELYRSMSQYMTVRGFAMRTPQFPLVAIVWRTQPEMLQYASREGVNIGQGVLGYYSLGSNRVTLFDQGGGHADGAEWQRNFATVVHEACHQTAYNTGIHNRFAPPPKWVAEGLGTLFEAPGVWNSSLYTKQSDRINAGRMSDFQQLAAKGLPAGTLAELVSSDRLFAQDANAAYAMSWALTFYLVETQQAEYAKYLAKTAALPQFEIYSSARRMSDFTASFGELKMLEARWLRYMQGLK